MAVEQIGGGGNGGGGMGGNGDGGVRCEGGGERDKKCRRRLTT
jgi:hypothetical protein